VLGAGMIKGHPDGAEPAAWMRELGKFSEECQQKESTINQVAKGIAEAGNRSSIQFSIYKQIALDVRAAMLGGVSDDAKRGSREKVVYTKFVYG
jgi:hypothetical protein